MRRLLLACAAFPALIALPGCDERSQSDPYSLVARCRDARGRFVTCPKPAPVTQPAPTWITSPSLAGLAPIASNFDVNLALKPMTPPPAPTTEIEHGRGAFRFICGAGQLLRDDPVVYPNQPGKSHLHQFFGNTAANANTPTYASVRAVGASTCNNLPATAPLKDFAANRSAYWMPAMLDGKGNVVQPDYVQVYYKRIPAGSPDCAAPGSGATHSGMGYCGGIPNGIRFVFGYDMLTGKSPTGATHFNCIGTGAVQGTYRTLAEAAQHCVAGGRVGAIILAPECWDGKNLDSPNHRDHVSYAFRNGYGQLQCPLTHPYAIPRFQMSAWYTIAPGDLITNWRFSSDEMRPDVPHGGTFHADYLEGWDPGVKAMWQAHCIDEELSCTLANTGGGKGLLGGDVPTYGGVRRWTNPNRLVPIP